MSRYDNLDTLVYNKNNTAQQTLDIRVIHKNNGSSEIHTTKNNEDAFRIALNYYGDATLWWKIVDANRLLITDPYNIPNDIEIIIPE